MKSTPAVGVEFDSLELAIEIELMIEFSHGKNPRFPLILIDFQ